MILSSILMVGFLASGVLTSLSTPDTTTMVNQQGHQQQQQQPLQTLLSRPTSDFSQRLYQYVAVGNDSLVYSPYSIHSALSMTSTGARGETLSQMRKVLGLSALAEKTSLAYHDLIVKLNTAKKVSLNTANAVFVNPAETINPAFIDKVTLKYFATASNFNLNAQGGPEKDINDYVAQKTENLIQNILSPGSIDASTIMVLVNTIFFNGTWMYPFAEFKTRPQDFYQLGGTKKQISMMNDDQWLRFKRDSTRRADILEMPFKGYRFSLYILLPHEKDGVASLEKTLVNGVDDLFQNLTRTHLSLSIPKFKVETRLKLSPTLMAMGMKKAFLPSVADFTGISSQGGVYLNQVIHQALIEVKETGTVAAAATVTGIRALAFMPPSERFVADHPFIFFIRDFETGQILFQGKFSG